MCCEIFSRYLVEFIMCNENLSKTIFLGRNWWSLEIRNWKIKEIRKNKCGILQLILLCAKWYLSALEFNKSTNLNRNLLSDRQKLKHESQFGLTSNKNIEQLASMNTTANEAIFLLIPKKCSSKLQIFYSTLSII